jgi:hypothetical protein
MDNVEEAILEWVWATSADSQTMDYILVNTGKKRWRSYFVMPKNAHNLLVSSMKLG